jgi:hypothetical protein
MANTDARALVAYDEDFHGWILEQIAMLETARWRDLDIENLIEELKAVAASERNEIDSRLTVLLQHLLKWEFQPERRSNSWRATIIEQRMRINDVIERSPSLRRYPGRVLDREYVPARLRASDETGLPIDQIPEPCPYAIGQVLDEEFWPGDEPR